MFKATFKSLFARKLRLMMSALAIVLGIAFVAGSLMFTNLLSRSFDEIVKSAVGDVNVVRADTGFEDFTTSIPETAVLLSQDDVDRIAAVDGIERSQPLVTTSQVFMMDTDDRVVAISGAPGIGSNWHETPAAGGLQGVRIIDGRPPEANGEVVVDPGTVERSGHKIGDEVRIATPLAGVATMKLVGTATYGTGSTAGASYLFFTLDDATRLLADGAEGYQGVWIQTEEGADPDTVAKAVGALLNEQWQAKTGAELAKDVEETLAVGMGFVNNFLLIFAAIALLVATLLILNTFSILVAQRAREMALLRAIGATRRQVRGSVLLEALVVGVIGSVVGILVGYLLVWVLLGVMARFGLTLGGTVPQLTWQAVVLSFAIGITVTLVAALTPAVRASRMRPVEALTETTAPTTDGGGGGVLNLGGIVAIEIAMALLVIGTFLAVPLPLAWVGAGAALLLVGMVLAAPVIGRPVIAGLGWLFGKVFGEVGRFARRNSTRQPRRTAATASTLMIGLALVTTVAVLAASVTTSMRTQLTAEQRGDFVLSPSNFQPFDARVADRAADVDGVEWVASFVPGNGTAEDSPDPVTLTGTTPRALREASTVELFAGAMTDEPDSAVISNDFADDRGLTMGQLFDVKGTKGTARVLVTGISDPDSAPADIILHRDTFAGITDDSLIRQAVVFTEPGADPDQVREGLREATGQTPTVVVSDIGEFIDEQVGRFQVLVNMLYGLLGLALVISVLGIVNTLGLSVIERTREIGLLRAVGLTRPQVRRMMTLESVLITVMGSLLGVALGLSVGAALQHVNRDAGVSMLDIPWLQVGLFVVAAAVFGWIAALLPARRAARLPVLDSISRD